MHGTEVLNKRKAEGLMIDILFEIEDMHLEEPKLVKHSSGYGVRLKASAP